jgi:hypothetical protein
VSSRAPRNDSAGEDWSGQHSEAALVAHVRDRVACYRSAPVNERIVDEFDALAARWR